MDVPELQWNTHNSLMDCVQLMYKNHLNTGDVIIEVGKHGEKVRVHKFILICRSRVFLTELANRDPNTLLLEISDIKKDIFLQFVE